MKHRKPDLWERLVARRNDALYGLYTFTVSSLGGGFGVWVAWNWVL